jgi:hypothetical protein
MHPEENGGCHTMNPRHEELFERYVLGTLTESESAELTALFAGDTGIRRAFVAYVEEWAILAEVSGEMTASYSGTSRAGLLEAPTERQAGLFEGYVHGTLTADDEAELKVALADAQSREAFVAYVEDWAMMADVAEEVSSAQSTVTESGNVIPFQVPARPRVIRAVMSLAAAVLVAAVVWMAFWQPEASVTDPTPAPTPTAENEPAAEKGVWSLTAGGEANDIPKAVSPVGTSDYIFVATTESWTAGGEDIWVVRSDIHGNVKWQYAWGTDADDSAAGVVGYPDGRAVIVGTTPNPENGEMDGWLLAVDESGERLWERRLESTGGDYPTSLIRLTDGGLAMAGIRWPNGKIGHTHDHSVEVGIGPDEPRLWVVGLTDEGETRWSLEFDVSMHTSTGKVVTSHPSICETEPGRIAVTQSMAFGPSDFNAFVAGLTTDGDIVWQREIGNVDAQRIEAVSLLIPDGRGGVYCIGSVSTAHASPFDFWIAAVDRFGEVSWERQIGTDRDDIMLGGCTTSTGVLMSGVRVVPRTGDVDGTLIFVDQDGNLEMSSDITPPGDEILAPVVTRVDEDGYLIFGNCEYPNGTADAWLSRMSSDRTMVESLVDLPVAFRALNTETREGNVEARNVPLEGQVIRSSRAKTDAK